MILRVISVTATAGAFFFGGCEIITGSGPKRPHGLWIGETGVAIPVGESITLTARVQETGSSRSGIESAEHARWWTDDSDVIRLSSESEGRVEALRPGRATVWVQVGARRDSANVTVVAEDDEPTHRWKAVSSSQTGTCALDSSGYAFCWGDDFWGGWGDGGERRQFTNAYRPVRVDSPLQFEEITKGLGFACARTSAGEVWCWGLHWGSRLGHTRISVDYEPGPVRVDFPGRATAVTTGSQHACLLDENGRAHCWGSNLASQLGTGLSIGSSRDRGGRTLPVAFDSAFHSLSSGGYHSCGITQDQDLYCWGMVPIGGGFQSATLPTPRRVPIETAPASVYAGNGNTCVLTGAGEALCWGANTGGQSGRSLDHPGSDVPVPIESDLRFDKLALSGGMTCGIEAGGELWCWGAGSALDSTALQTCSTTGGSLFPCTGVPVPVAGDLRFDVINVGEAVCGITVAGELYCWGQNEWGQLGNGRPDIESTSTPQRVLDPL